ncbi:MAG TPA: tRNA (adenosine(37)-N6)-threonylcarbamoyltransferase complex dimerization subunit type 1 TsaB [Candidatus Babeliales bacterium]|nr:tRNA (adenosine(37)-N6)-threonylcarbamoyltransferase complex dimerization subunit type 1 TsaB [Candidatus Babeliales bacterium]
MSQQKISSSVALVLQSTYEQIEIGLLVNGQLTAQVSLPKAIASSQILLVIDQLLRAQACQITDLQFIAANLGPAPFTSLRVVIATVNGLGFATGIPLIGVNGLQAFVTEFALDQRSLGTTLALLNAYNQDLYYGLLDQSGQFSSGWGKAVQLLPELAQQLRVAGVHQINLIGNGMSLFAAQIAQNFVGFTLVTATAGADPTQPITALELDLASALANFQARQYCSLARVSQLAQQLYLDPANHSTQLQPLYLKTVQVVVNKNYTGV